MRAPAVVRLPPLLKALFPHSERVVKIQAETVEDVMNGLEARWPGMRDRLSGAILEGSDWFLVQAAWVRRP